MENYIITDTIDGETSVGVVEARSENAVMKYLLKKENWSPGEMNGFRWNFPTTPRTRGDCYVAELMTTRMDTDGRKSKTEGFYMTHEDPKDKIDDDLQPLIGKSKDECIDLLSPADTKLLFKWLFTGGFGHQDGTPGKEWFTLSVDKIDDLKVTKRIL